MYSLVLPTSPINMGAKAATVVAVPINMAVDNWVVPFTLASIGDMPAIWFVRD